MSALRVVGRQAADHGSFVTVRPGRTRVSVRRRERCRDGSTEYQA
jgi:hypothetical protein